MIFCVEQLGDRMIFIHFAKLDPVIEHGRGKTVAYARPANPKRCLGMRGELPMAIRWTGSNFHRQRCPGVTAPEIRIICYIKNRIVLAPGCREAGNYPSVVNDDVGLNDLLSRRLICTPLSVKPRQKVARSKS
jgi:hypothetical protein